MTTSWKKLFALSVLGVALHAVAQVNMRPEVAKTLQAAQEALQAKQPELALQKIQEARATPQLTEPEKMFLERLSVMAAMNAQKFELAFSSLDYLLQSKELSAADRLILIETMVSVNLRSKDYPKVVQWARRYEQEGGKKQSVHVVKVKALALQGLHEDILKEMQDAYRVPGYEADESELRIYAFSQKRLKDDAGYLRTLTELVTRFPSKDYWSDLLANMGRASGVTARTQLDIFRLMFAAGVANEAEDYLDAALFALKAGLPHEALRILEQGQAADLYKGPMGSTYIKLKNHAQRSISEDEKAMKSMSLASDNGPMLVQFGDVLMSKGQWVAAIEAYQKAISKGGLKREADVRLHIGIALLKANQSEQAKDMLRSVEGDSSAVQMAGLWISLVK